MYASKYRAKKEVVDGIKFDSKREAKRFTELKRLEGEGKISDLELQPRFELQPSYKKNGKTIRAITYKADFRYKDECGNEVIEDAKGMKTEVYKIKKKLFEYIYKDKEIREV